MSGYFSGFVVSGFIWPPESITFIARNESLGSLGVSTLAVVSVVAILLVVLGRKKWLFELSTRTGRRSVPQTDLVFRGKQNN